MFFDIPELPSKKQEPEVSKMVRTTSVALKTRELHKFQIYVCEKMEISGNTLLGP